MIFSRILPVFRRLIPEAISVPLVAASKRKMHRQIEATFWYRPHTLGLTCSVDPIEHCLLHQHGSMHSSSFPYRLGVSCAPSKSVPKRRITAYLQPERSFHLPINGSNWGGTIGMCPNCKSRRLLGNCIIGYRLELKWGRVYPTKTN